MDDLHERLVRGEWFALLEPGAEMLATLRVVADPLWLTRPARGYTHGALGMCLYHLRQGIHPECLSTLRTPEMDRLHDRFVFAPEGSTEEDRALLAYTRAMLEKAEAVHDREERLRAVAALERLNGQVGP